MRGPDRWIGVGLALLALVVMVRSWRGLADDHEATQEARKAEHYGSAAAIIGAVVAYIALADRIGFLLVAPLCLLAVFLALRVKPVPALLWAVAGTIVVHVAFYKLLRVPLPWGVLRPFY